MQHFFVTIKNRLYNNNPFLYESIFPSKLIQIMKEDPKKPAHEVIFSRKKMKKPILVSFIIILKFLVLILKSTCGWFLIASLLLKNILRIN